MRSQKWLFTAVISLAAVVSAFGVTYSEDDTMPEVRDRVARISVMQGDVQIKRADSDEWEAATANLPLVEGDAIATGEKARLEIQFENDKFARIDENSLVKVVNLNYSGIALSLSQGSLQVSLLDSGDADENVEVQEYFEVDAPRTTVAFLQPGSYRIDAGANEVRVTVPGEGEARIYSAESGFTLGSVRSAVLALTGEYAGEWNTHAVFSAMDTFDGWVNERTEIVTEQLANANYDEYYDDDIYGAEDLNDNGEWIHTSQYGYIWQPYSSAISAYSNWSPYRYGQWRWVSPYGWVWVNDEPWGWATYHYGRWIYYHGRWAWTPYGYYRWGRSWWSPALVLMNVTYGYVSWCPLPYYYAYYNYNYHYWNGHHGGGHHGGHNPTPTPTPPAAPTPIPPKVDPTLSSGPVPDPTTVVSIPADRFGNGARNFVKPSAEVAHSTVQVKPTDAASMPTLPGRMDNRVTGSRDVRIARPIVETRSMNTTARVGAAPRTESAPLDKTLREKTIFGGRTPVRTRTTPGIDPGSDPVRVERTESGTIVIETPRKTGAVTRPATPRETPVRPGVTPGINPGVNVQRDTRPIVAPTKRESSPVRTTPTRPSSPVRVEPAPASRPSTPTRSAPTRSAPTRSAPTRSAPTRSVPTRSAPTRSTSAPSRPTSSPSKSSSTSSSGSKSTPSKGKRD